MTMIADAYINALLADACYINNLIPDMTGLALAEKIGGRMTPALATYIGNNFTVIQQLGGLSSSLDVTVWRGNAGTPYAGQVYVSMRGTQEGPDYVADGDLASSGLAHRQLVDMVNWWLRETTAARFEDGTPRFATQITLTADNDFASGMSVLGTGNLVNIGTIHSVNGHSLGGYLASAFVRLFGTQLPATAISTFNSAGFSKQAAANIQAGFSQIAQLIGPTLGLAGFSSAQNNYFGANGINVTTNTWDPVGFQQYGTRLGLFQEDSGGFSNHSMYKLADLLALGDALARLDSTLDFSKLSKLVSAGSNQMAASYEGLLDSVRRLVGGPSVPPTPPSDASGPNTGQPQARIDFQANLRGLTDNGAFMSLAGRVTIASVSSNLATRAKARLGFEEIVALQTLSPFVLSPVGADGVAALAALWSTVWGNEYQAWTADKASLQSGGEASAFTNSWINDRSMLIKDVLQINTMDITTGIVTDSALPTDRAVELRYFDPGSQQSKTLTAQNPSFSMAGNTSARQLISFGSDANESLSGTASRFGDHIYGGGGNDTIDGLAGDDYLEGNAGDDTLDGGKGVDTLKGGQGNDTYTLRADTSDVTDTIIDSDGLGCIKVYGLDGRETVLTMAGGKKLADGSNIWQSQDQRFTFTLIAESGGPNTLRIDGAGVKALVRNFTSGNLGIDLPGAAAVPADPTTNLTILGDLQPANDPPQQDELGNVITTDVAAPGRNDILFDSTDDDEIDAGAGADLVTASRGGNDWIRSEDGDDVVFEYGGDDLIELGAGRDVGYGGSGNDRIYGNTVVGLDVVLAQTVVVPAGERNILDGGSGDDTVVADAAGDALFGAGGKDVLVGGAGDDNMFGDVATSKTLYGIPDVQRVLGYDAQGHVIGRSVVFTALEHELPQEQDADLMLGGAGADLMLGDGGDDYLDGGVDSDCLAGGAGSDALLGAEGDDELDGDGTPVGAASLGYVAPELHGNDFLDGGAGDDSLVGGGGDDELFGGDGVDRLFGDNGSLDASFHGHDYLDGGAGTDTLVGEGGDDQLVGGSGDDVLSGDSTSLAGSAHGQDHLDGGDGADLLFGDGGDDELFGGAQDDALWGDSDTLATPYQGNDYLDGEDGNDQLVGNAGDDQLFGDDDIIAEANHGNDYMDGEEGNDYLRGYGGDDVLVGGTGDDTLIGEAGNDTFEGGGGWDLYSGGAGDDTYVFNVGDTNGLALAEFIDDSEGVNHIRLNGMAIDAIELWPTTDGEIDLVQSGNEAIFVRGLRTGAIGTVEVNGVTYSAAQFFGKTYAWPVEISTSTPASALQGGKGSDTLVATGGNSTLAGGLGSDVLSGSGGGNTYVYDAGDGHDFITDTSSPDLAGTLSFGAGVSAQDIRLSHAEGKLVLTIAGDSADSVRIAGFDANNAMNATGVDRFEFADGTVLTHAELAARGFDIEGAEGNDFLQGTNVADRLTGKAGNDTLSGRGGDDVYTFNVGDAADTIADADAALGSNDVLALGDYISPDLVRVGRQGDDLLLDLSDLGASDRITLRDYFGGGADAVEHIRFADGTNWTQADVLALLSSGTNGDDTITGSAGDDLLTGGRGNDSLTGLAGNDTLSGGPGTDTIDGGTGDDVYLFSLGDGSDTVLDAGGSDVLRLGTGIAATDTSIHDDGTDLIVRIGTAGDQVTLRGYLAASPNAALIETIEFQDGTSWTLADVLSRRLAGSGGDDVITGFDREDSVDALGGNDVVYGRAGADTLRGGEGNDQLFGQAGNDTYVVYPQDGSDLVSEANGGLVGDADKLLFAGGLVQADFTFAQEGMDLLVTSALKGVAVRVVNQFAALDNSNGVEVIEFSDGAVLDRAALRRLLSILTAGDDAYIGDDTGETIDALAGNDTVYARGGDDMLRGNTGSDVLYGGAGNDIYDYRPGDGLDIVDDQDPSAGGGGMDTLQLGAGISAAAVTLVRSGDNLIVNTGAAGDSVTITGYYSRGDFERITFSDGTAWNQEDIAAKLPINGSAGADTLIGTAAADLIDGGAGKDIIRGGAGDDTLRGGTDTSKKASYVEQLYGEAGNDVITSGNKLSDLYGGPGNDIITGNYGLDGGDGNDLLIGTVGNEWISFNQTGNNIIIGGKGRDSYSTPDYAAGKPRPLGRNLLLYNTGDGAELGYNGENRYVSTNDIVSIGLTNYSKLALSGGVGYDEVGLASGRDIIPEALYDLVPESNDTKYLQIIVSSSDYSATSTDPLRNRKVVVIDIEAWGREFYATVTTNRNYDLLAALRRHIAWSSDTQAFGGKIAYEYGTKGNIDAVTLQERRAIMADPNLNLLGQPISGSQVTALTSAESPDAGMLTDSSAFPVDTGMGQPREKKTSVQTSFLAPDIGRFAIEACASPLSTQSFAAGRRQAQARQYSDLSPMNDEPNGGLLDSAKAPDSARSCSDSSQDSPAPLRAVELPARRASEFRDYVWGDAADTANTRSDGARSLSTDRGFTSASSLWARVDAWSRLERALMAAGPGTADSDHWESPLTEPRLATGLANAGPEPVSLGNVVRLERVASFGIANLAA